MSRENMNFSCERKTLQKLQQSVNYVLHEYCYMENYLKFFSVSAENLFERNSNPKASMKSEKFVIIDSGSDLWDETLISAVEDITVDYYPHFTIMQKLINYALNSIYIDSGLLEMLFSKLLLFYPPKGEMQNYYWSIINEKYVRLTENGEENKNIFWCMIEAATDCLKKQDSLSVLDDDKYRQKSENAEKEIIDSVIKLSKNKKKDWQLECLNKKVMTNFVALQTSDKFRRAVIILNFLYNILEFDFTHKIRVNENKNGFMNTNTSFLSMLLWKNGKNVGTVNRETKKLINAFKLCQESTLYGVQVIHKLFTLTAEVIRTSDVADNPVYPFLGENCGELVDYVSSASIGSFSDSEGENKALVSLQPHWLRLLVSWKFCCQLIGSCSLELSTICDVFEYAIILSKENKMEGSGDFTQRSLRCRPVATIDFPAATNSVSTCHRFCKLKRTKNDQFFTVSELNSVNEKGWAPLHEAVMKSHEGCLRELLTKKRKSIDLKLRGLNGFTPLMCAVVEGNAKTCRLLLEHSGSNLIEDVNDEGQTPVDLCSNKEVARILNYFKNRSGSKKFWFSAKNLEALLNICVQIVESYFITYRTLDVYKRYTSSVDKPSGAKKAKREAETTSRWDYSRYYSDIKHISTLSTLLTELKFLRKIRSLNRLERILTLNHIF